MEGKMSAPEAPKEIAGIWKKFLGGAAVLLTAAALFWRHPIALYFLGCENLLLNFSVDDLTAKTGKGAFVTDWDEIKKCVNHMSFDRASGEVDHPLVPNGEGVIASIFPRADIWTAYKGKIWTAYKGKTWGRIIAKVESKGQHHPLGIGNGDNYLFAWLDIETASGPKGHSKLTLLMVNEDGRTALSDPEYMAHSKATPAAPIIGPDARLRDFLSPGALECQSDKTRRACFVDSNSQWRVLPGPGIGGPLFLGESQPWVACVILGCCCGGHQCHGFTS
jgi:hypothetical protein